MDELRYHELAERDHDLQNPTNPEKIRLLGERMRLAPESRVLDVACGRGGPALVLAREFGCSIVGVDISPVFAGVARERIAAAGLQHLVEIHQGNGAEFVQRQPKAWDAALCLGATFVWGHAADAATALTPAVRRGGHVAVGEPYWRRWPLPSGLDDWGYVPLQETAARFERSGLTLVSLIESSTDDWDTYETLQWRAVAEWLDENPSHADAPELRQRHEAYKRRYLESLRDLLGWAIFVGRKPHHTFQPGPEEPAAPSA